MGRTNVRDNCTLSRSLEIGLFMLIVPMIATGLCTANQANDTATAMQAEPGITNPMEPQAYMRELAERLKSAEGKESLLQGIDTQTPRPANPKPAVKKPAGTATAKPVAAQPTPPRPNPVQGPPPRAVLTQPLWSQPIASEPVPAPSVPAQPAPTQAAPAQPVPEPPAAAQPVPAQPALPELTLIEPSTPVARPDVTATAIQDSNQAQAQRPPLEPSTWLAIYDRARERGLIDTQTEHATKAKAPWSLGSDLDKYRAYSVKDGSRDSGENLAKALGRAGLAVNDGVNVFMLGYASDRAQAFRANDGKGLLDEPGKVPQQAAATLGELGDGLYSLADLITLNGLPDPNKPAYRDNAPIVRPLVFAGRTIGGAWKTTEEIGNAVTWGYFDNVTGCLGLLLEDIIEVLKHTGEAVTNVARVPVHAIGAKNENADRTMDWALLVPLELASNSVQMKGVSNMVDYKTAFADKGVIGSLVEFGGSSFVLYRAIDKAADECKKDHKHHNGTSNNSGGDNGGGSTPEVPAEEPGVELHFFWWPTEPL